MSGVAVRDSGCSGEGSIEEVREAIGCWLKLPGSDVGIGSLAPILGVGPSMLAVITLLVGDVSGTRRVSGGKTVAREQDVAAISAITKQAQRE